TNYCCSTCTWDLISWYRSCYRTRCHCGGMSTENAVSNPIRTVTPMFTNRHKLQAGQHTVWNIVYTSDLLYCVCVTGCCVVCDVFVCLVLSYARKKRSMSHAHSPFDGCMGFELHSFSHIVINQSIIMRITHIIRNNVINGLVRSSMERSTMQPL